MEEASQRRHHRGGIMEEVSWRRHHGGGIWEAPGSNVEASGRHLGGVWRGLREASWGSGAPGHLGGKSNQNHCILKCLSSRLAVPCGNGAPHHHNCMYAIDFSERARLEQTWDTFRSAVRQAARKPTVEALFG